ncbi:MAG: N-acetylglucosamine-6-phosphate deacetylase [Candidatus Binatales bacterium]
MKHLSGAIACGDGRTFAGRVGFAERIETVEAASAGGDDYILPGFIDLQLNGSHGIDVMTASPDELVSLAGHLAREGICGFTPTAVTAPLEQIERAHAAIAGAIAAQTHSHDTSAAGAAILGMHLEGPFISSARLGAHVPLNLEPRGIALDRVLGLGNLRVVTLAPELHGALDAIRRFCARDVVVSIGHTDATLAEAEAGIAAGARMFTHLFNAMRPLRHRDPGVIAAAMLAREAKPAVIPDGIHVDPAMLALVYRVRGAAGMLMTTDKVALGGESAGASRQVGRAYARVEAGAARLADGTLAGSVISMLDGARLMVEKVGVSVGEVAMMASANPAAMLGLEDRGKLKPGGRADLLVLSRELKLKAVYIGGREMS